MSTLRTFNLQNPDSGTVNIEMDQGGNTLMTGIATVRGAAHFTSTSGSDAVGIGTDITAYKLDVRVTGAEAGLRVYNPDTSSNASGIIRLGNDDNQNSAFLKLNGANNSSTVGGAANLVLGTGTAREVHLATSGTSRLHITSDGKVAIGFNAPAVAGLSIANSSTSLGFEFDTASGFAGGPTIRGYHRPSTAYKSLGITGADIKFGINDVEKLRLDSNGYLGLNNSAPHNQYYNNLVIGDGSASGDKGITIRTQSSNEGVIAFSDADSGAARYAGKIAYNHGTNAMMFFTTNGDERFRVTSGGDLGLGVNGGMNQAGTLYIQGGQGVRWTHTSDGTLYGDHYVSASGQHVFRTGVNLTERLRIDSSGSLFAGGSIITESDMNWNHDTYQRPHIFTGVTGGNPSDGCMVLASPETNPGGTRIGSIVFGCKTSSSSGTSNSGIKATIECNTNSNTSDAWRTGASMTFKTRPNWGNITEAQTIHHTGAITKPLQPAFRAYSTGFSKNTSWQKITFGTENYDIGGYYDHANSKFTATVAGRYVFYAGGWAASTSADSRYAFCARVNGGALSYIAGAHYGNVDSPMAGYSVIHNLAANDYVELLGYSAVATTWGGSSHVLFWGGYLLG